MTSAYLRNTAKSKYGTKTSSFSTPNLGGFQRRILDVFLERKCLVHSDLIYFRIKHILRKLSIGSDSNVFSLQSLNQKYVLDLPSCLSRRGLYAVLSLKSVIEEHYKCSADWTGTHYIDISLDWDYVQPKVHLSIPGYKDKVLKQCHRHKTSTSSTHLSNALQSSTAPRSSRQNISLTT